MIGNETNIITLLEDTDRISPQGPSYQFLLDFALQKTASDSQTISLSAKIDKSIIGEVYLVSKGGKNFIFIRFNTFDGILSKMVVSADFDLKIRIIYTL